MFGLEVAGRSEWSCSSLPAALSWRPAPSGPCSPSRSGRGLIADSYMIARGINVAGYLVWIVIHSAVIVSGLLALRGGPRVPRRLPSTCDRPVSRRSLARW